LVVFPADGAAEYELVVCTVMPEGDAFSFALLAYIKNKSALSDCSARRFKINMAATYSPGNKVQVPSAIRGLTALFGMGRGEHPWNNHHKKLEVVSIKF
jgi:hypothetical protein